MLQPQRVVAIAVLVAAAIGGTACAPRIVTQITGSQDQVKLLYNRDSVSGYDTGVIQCSRTQEGNLEHCKVVTIEWNEPEQK